MSDQPVSDKAAQPGDNVDEALPAQTPEGSEGGGGTGDAKGTGDGWSGWYDYTAFKARSEEKTQQLRAFSEDALNSARTATIWRLGFQLIVSGLLVIGGAWALYNAIQMLIIANAMLGQSALTLFEGTSVVEPTRTLTPNTAFLLIPSLAGPVLLALLGLGLLGMAVGVNRYPVIQRGLLGISQFQHELAAGSGETRPLVQVVEETISNSRQTFLVQLRIGEAAFWVGLAALAIALGRVAFGLADWVTGLTGAGGLVAWLFAYANAQRKGIQKNLADITQLELGLVAIAKQVSYLDQWLQAFVIGYAGLIPASLIAETKRSVGWALQELQKDTFAAVGLVELYAQEAEKDDDADRRKLLNEAVRRHAGLAGAQQVSELAEIAGDYTAALAGQAGVVTLADLRKAGAKPEGRQKLNEATGIRPETILEFVRLADLMRVPSLTAGGARLLRSAKIESMADLAKADAAPLRKTLDGLNVKQELMSMSPTAEEVANWVEQAKGLPEEVTV